MYISLPQKRVTNMQQKPEKRSPLYTAVRLNMSLERQPQMDDPGNTLHKHLLTCSKGDGSTHHLKQPARDYNIGSGGEIQTCSSTSGKHTCTFYTNFWGEGGGPCAPYPLHKSLSSSYSLNIHHSREIASS